MPTASPTPWMWISPYPSDPGTRYVSTRRACTSTIPARPISSYSDTVNRCRTGSWSGSRSAMTSLSPAGDRLAPGLAAPQFGHQFLVGDALAGVSRDPSADAPAGQDLVDYRGQL